MFIFGGIDQHQERFNDIHEFNFESLSWTRVITIGQPPSPRSFHQSLVDAGYLYVIGGFDGWKRNDMFRILIDLSKSENELENNHDSVGFETDEVLDDDLSAMLSS